VTALANLKLLDFIGDVDQRTGRVRISREARILIAQLASEASRRGTYGVDVSYEWRSDVDGVFPGPDASGPWPTGLVADLVVVFYTESAQVATMTIRGFLTTATGQVHASELAHTGQALTARFVTAASGDTVRVDVTHTASGSIASASFRSVDHSHAGGSPEDLQFGGGGGGSGGTK
jgi:hypothetical protein